MDQQVPASVVEPKRGSDFAGFWTEQNPFGNKPVELPRCPRNEAPDTGLADRSGDRDAPKPPEKTPSIAADHGRDSHGEFLTTTRLKQDSQACRLPGSNPARVHSVESFSRQRSVKDAAIRRVDEASILSSRRSANSHSSRSLYQGSLLEETIKNNPPHVLPQPPQQTKEDIIFPGNTNRLAQLKIGNELSKEPVLGGSCREPRSCDRTLGVSVCTAPSSLPSSPCSSSIEFLRALKSSKESRASKLWRKLKLSGIRSRAGANLQDTKSGKRSSSSSSSSSRGVGNLSNVNPIISQHRKLVKSWESQAPELRNHGVQEFGNRMKQVPTIQSECMKVGSNSNRPTQRSSVPSQEGNVAAAEHSTRGSRWVFKWRWGSKTTMATGKSVVAESRPVSPTANIMSDARARTLYTKSDRFASGRVKSGRTSRHRRGSSWGCASLGSTAVRTQTGSLQSAARITTPNSHDLNGSSQSRSRVTSRIDRGGPQSSRIEEAYRNFQESFRGHSYRSMGGQSFRSAGGQSFGGQSFRKDQVFEDCHGSFRSIGSNESYGSFRSFDSLGGESNRFPSVESEMEWDSRLPPPLQGDQNQTIDVASLCNSSLKFVFKCREIQHFNRFLKTQKKCILRGLEKGNTDCFHIILSGTDIEVSSMVTAMCYAWFLENTVPKVTGETWHAIPVIDIPRHQMHKHKDAAWLFDACGIQAAALLFADEIEMASLSGTGRIKTSAIAQDVLVTRNEVGSVCTLLGEKLLAEAQCLLEPRYMKTILLAGILLDTENHDFASKRDTEMTTTLLVGSGSLGRNGFFNQLKGVEDDERVSKFITRNYGEDKQPSTGGKVFSGAQSKTQEEVDQEQFDKDSLFTPSQDQTSTSEAGTTSSVDEDSPRLKQRSSFKYTKLHPHSAPARSHHLPSPSSAGCNEDEMSAALRRKAATRCASSAPACGARSPSPTRIQKRLFLYQA